ncbi:response regulator transcription factor [Rhodanobacter denitrificans]|uniref:response regulator transcription factor n=1 Tax=Rhodanobacteraceae TaxID=1775411 RepID=UPI000260D086|nr:MULTISPECIES: response regulator transcription factor [Rhodanobacteraceae]EIM04299.1 winged helix family two component transcriptional regulator [Rhodanobacter denitrificans]MCX7515237.1 response regulator transcription factor [Frateuria sp. STR12]UJM89007.1 response regulator transcription factor [Rhodanobacter denitrificans]
MKLLLVEDSQRLRQMLQQGLRGEGFTVDAAADGMEARSFLGTYEYELVVLDLMLPRLDGIGVLRGMATSGRRPRVLVLSARDQVGDRVEALNAGADDYLMKPFAFDELLARLHALSRRPNQAQPLVLSHGALALDPRAHSASVDGEPLNLTPRELALLGLLLRHRGRAFTRSEILDWISGSESEVSDRSVEVLVFGLRRKLDAAGVGGLIETRRGAGYLIA